MMGHGTRHQTKELLMSNLLSLGHTRGHFNERDEGPKFTEGKGKVVPVLLTEHNPMKAYWRVEV
jgi:hypothetical protein